MKNRVVPSHEDETWKAHRILPERGAEAVRARGGSGG